MNIIDTRVSLDSGSVWNVRPISVSEIRRHIQRLALTTQGMMAKPEGKQKMHKHTVQDPSEISFPPQNDAEFFN